MAIKTQTVIPADFPVTRCEPGRARGLEPLKMRAKGNGAPPENGILRGRDSALVQRIKHKARIARTTTDDVARALCFLKYGG